MLSSFSDFTFFCETVWIRPSCLLCFLAEEIIFVTQRELPGHTKKYENSPCKEFNGLGVYVRGPSVRKLETDMFSLISWRQVRFCWRVGTDRPHQHSFQSTWWDEHVSLRKLVKDMMLLVSFHSDLFIALTKETAVSRKEILHESNKEIWIWSLDWKSSLYQKKQKNKKQLLYNLIKNNTVVAICFYKVHTNNLLALKHAFF